MIRGRIVEEQKTYYFVDIPQGIIRTTLKGVAKKLHQRLFVGDFVDIELFNSDTPEGIIRQLHPRKNRLERPVVSNIDQIIQILSFKEPLMDLEFIDSFLFTADTQQFPTVLVFNKCDLLDVSESAALDSITAYYEKIGYPCLCMSALVDNNFEQLVGRCEKKLSVFAGPSGTGKSTILSSIFPEHAFRIGELSQIHRGAHTTTHTTLLKLSENTYIADTPGFSQIQLPAIDEDQVGAYFSEFRSAPDQCKFSNCIHENEPGCVIKDMVRDGTIMRSRYESYLKIYHNIHQNRRNYRHMR